MNYKSRFSGSVLAAFVAVVMLAVPVAGNAQDTTGSIRGKVLDPSGSPVGGATIVVEDMRSGVTRTLTTSNSMAPRPLILHQSALQRRMP